MSDSIEFICIEISFSRSSFKWGSSGSKYVISSSWHLIAFWKVFCNFSLRNLTYVRLPLSTISSEISFICFEIEDCLPARLLVAWAFKRVCSCSTDNRKEPHFQWIRTDLNFWLEWRCMYFSTKLVKKELWYELRDFPCKISSEQQRFEPGWCKRKLFNNLNLSLLFCYKGGNKPQFWKLEVLGCWDKI